MSHFLVLGGTSGVGLDVARKLVLMNAEVTIAGRDGAKLLSAVDELNQLRGSDSGIYPLQLQLEIDPVETGSTLIRMFHNTPLDGVFHAAGVESIWPAHMSKASYVDNAPLYGLMAIARAASRILLDGASVVVMSSVAAHRGSPGMLAYSATKSAIEGAVRALAVELAPRVRVNAIAAGAFHSPMQDRVTRSIGDEASKNFEAKHLLGFGTAHDVACAALFLLTEGSRWITGTTMVVDGGYLARG